MKCVSDSGRRHVLPLAGMMLVASFATPVLAADQAPANSQASFLQIVMTGAGWLGPVMGLISLWSAIIIFEHFFTIRRSTMISEAEVRETRELVERRQFKECIEKLSKSRTMFGDVLTVGLRHGRHGFQAMQEAVEERAMAWRSRLFRRVEYLNIIGNICPLLGLLGTVIGMIESFQRMRSGAYGADNLAGGISLALVSTFLGLIVAIVSMLFFGICRNRVDSLTVAAHASSVDILEYFRPAPVVPGTAAGGASTIAGNVTPAGAAPVSAGPFTGSLPGSTVPRPTAAPLNPPGPVQLAD
ncbi:MAG: MotA/TolQ/ExbB proton channel family protein [Phycisphaerae bacterium]|nr:MotA/TolQ/ExbB proton channel family protein [Phycisphaerae bacterium]